MKKSLLIACVFLLLCNISMAQQAKQDNQFKKNLLVQKTNAEKIQAKKEFKSQFKSGTQIPASEIILPSRIKE